VVQPFNRPLDRVYPVIFIDAIVVKVRDGQVRNKPMYLARIPGSVWIMSPRSKRPGYPEQGRFAGEGAGLRMRCRS
jgi:hypothetical protein